MYRKFIHRGDLRIQLKAIEGKHILFDQDARVSQSGRIASTAAGSTGVEA